MAKLDLTGKVFGRLRVLREAEPTRSPAGKSIRRWHCICTCGKELDVNQNALTATKNGTRSCGCAQAEAMRKKASQDFVGKRFGRLVVMSPIEASRKYPNGTRTVWLCQCDCGNQITCTKKSLTSGDVRSCGCLLSETARAKQCKTGKNVLGFYDGTMISAIKPTRKMNKNNSSGVQGVYWSESEQLWIAKIGIKGKSKTLGRFRDKEKAIAARKAAEKEYFAPIIEKYRDENQKETDKDTST